MTNISVTKRFIMVLFIVTAFSNVTDTYLYPVPLGHGGPAYPRRNMRPQKAFYSTELTHLRQHKGIATMCMGSDDCPRDKFCCEVIKSVFNICCSDSMRSIDKGLVPILIPVEKEYDY